MTISQAETGIEAELETVEEEVIKQDMEGGITSLHKREEIQMVQMESRNNVEFAVPSIILPEIVQKSKKNQIK